MEGPNVVQFTSLAKICLTRVLAGVDMLSALNFCLRWRSVLSRRCLMLGIALVIFPLISHFSRRFQQRCSALSGRLPR
jgi:hypothetical protein